MNVKFNILEYIKLTDRVAPESVISDCISVKNLIGVNTEFTMEIWKDVPNTKGKYQVSNCGRLRTKKDGYLSASFYLSGKRWTKRVHSIVWECFGKGTPNHKLVIDHKDGDKKNNHIDNLQLISCRNNILKSDMPLRNKSGYTGVKFREDRNHWVARIMINGKRKYLGSYNTKEDARDAYLLAYSRLENNTKILGCVDG